MEQEAAGLAAGEADFIHQSCLYGSDDEFLAMAVPFISTGLGRGEPVLAATTSANLELLNTTLGERALGLDCAETAYFGRRPPQRLAAFDRYLKTHLGSPGHVRILAEPTWTGRSDRDVRAWKQMEARLNLIFADTRMWMICPYDTRILPPDIIADARRTHPSCASGADTLPNPTYEDPALFADGLEGGLLPRPPENAAVLTFAGDLAGFRHFVAETVTARGLTAAATALFVVAAAEAASYVRRGALASVAIWDRPGAVVCDISQPAGEIADLLPGWRPPELEQPRPDDGLWLARQVCEQVETRSANGASTIRLHMPSPRVLV